MIYAIQRKQHQRNTNAQRLNGQNQHDRHQRIPSNVSKSAWLVALCRPHARYEPSHLRSQHLARD